jgi:hypothetical protein
MATDVTDHDKSENSALVSGMSTRRKCVALTLLAALFGGHLYCVLTNSEHWPFSRYPMYAMIHKDTWTDEFLVGTLRDDPTVEVPISFFVYDRPISVKASLDHLNRKRLEDPARAEDLREALFGLGQLYLQKHGGHRAEDFHDIGSIAFVQKTFRVAPRSEGAKADEIERAVVMQVELPMDASMATAAGGRQ